MGIENKPNKESNKTLEETQLDSFLNPETVSVVGLGKLGLCVAACLAHSGYNVIGVDIDQKKISSINEGIAPTYEPRLAEMLKNCRDHLTSTYDYNYAIKNSEITFIIVNTPSNPDGSYSTKQLISAVNEIGHSIKGKDNFHVVAVVSTVLPGTINNEVKQILEKNSEKRCGMDFGLCYNPEFIALGSVIHDFLNPDFVLIGESDTKSGELLSRVYKKICENDPKIVRMGNTNAELTKIALNSYITMKISFANTLAEICERLPSGDVDVVTSTLGLDKRIGNKYIKGGLGFGGPCFPRDNKAFSYLAKQVNCKARLAEASDQVNENQVKRIEQIVESKLNGKGKIAILGLAYKPNTNVVEASQAIDIAKALVRDGYSISVYDPLGTDNAKVLLGNEVKYASSIMECITDVDLCIVATPLEEFKKINDECFAKVGKPIIIDCWRILDRNHFDEKTYVGIGLERSI